VDDTVQKIEEYELKNFTELKKFVPNGLKDQLCEIVLSNVKLGNSAIEQTLNEVAQVEYKWTCIDEGETKVVFIRFVDEDLLKNAKEIRRFLELEGLNVQGAKWGVSIEENTQQFLNDSKISNVSIDKDELNEKIAKILTTSLEQTHGNDDLDYQVDESELHDLPPELLPQLRKDIKDFRLKVLENEKKKREKESLEEMKRSKIQLRKLFEKFKNEDNQMVEDDEESDDEDDDDDEEGGGVTDEQYEAMRIEKENQEVLRKYNERVKLVLSEQRRNQYLIEELEDLKQYESSLDKTIYPEYESGKFKPSHRDKLLELEKDEADRQQESKEKEIAQQSQSFLNSINIPLKVSIPKETEESEQQEPSGDVIADMDDDQLSSILEKIKPNIETYIEEFLGMKEDELLEYILMIIKENKSKDNLVEELKETFDEDAIKMGDKVWNDLLSNV